LFCALGIINTNTETHLGEMTALVLQLGILVPQGQVGAVGREQGLGRLPGLGQIDLPGLEAQVGRSKRRAVGEQLQHALEYVSGEEEQVETVSMCILSRAKRVLGVTTQSGT
jgi:hypothetical protein